MLCTICHCRQLEDYLEKLDGVCVKCKEELEKKEKKEELKIKDLRK